MTRPRLWAKLWVLLLGAGASLCAGAETTRFVLEEGELSVSVDTRPARGGLQQVHMRFVPGERTRLNAAAGITVLATRDHVARTLGEAHGAHDRFYFEASPSATFTAPGDLRDVLVRLAYCPPTRSDCLLEEVRVRLPQPAP